MSPINGSCNILNYELWSITVELSCAIYLTALDGLWIFFKDTRFLYEYFIRTLTFILACILCCIISIGILVAICAGVAYGYNYSMAEFLTFTRQDVTVYMRRGQFYDKPDFDSDRDLVYRRSGDEVSPINKSVDYQDMSVNTHAKALPDTWSQLKDTRKYAEVLTKFSNRPDDNEQINIPLEYPTTETIGPFMSDAVFVTQPPPASMETLTPPSPGPPMQPLVQKVSISPNLLTTTLHRTRTSQIFLKNFPAQPLNNIPQERAEYRLDDSEDKSFYADEDNEKDRLFVSAEERPSLPLNLPHISNTLNEIPAMQTKNNGEVPMRHYWGKKSIQSTADYRDEIDEDNIVYKPV